MNLDKLYELIESINGNDKTKETLLKMVKEEKALKSTNDFSSKGRIKKCLSYVKQRIIIKNFGVEDNGIQIYSDGYIATFAVKEDFLPLEEFENIDKNVPLQSLKGALARFKYNNDKIFTINSKDALNALKCKNTIVFKLEDKTIAVDRRYLQGLIYFMNFKPSEDIEFHYSVNNYGLYVTKNNGTEGILVDMKTSNLDPTSIQEIEVR